MKDREREAQAAAAAEPEAQAAKKAEALAQKQRTEAERAALRKKSENDRRAAEVLTPALPVSKSPSVAISAPKPASTKDDAGDDWERALALPVLVLFWALTYDRLLDEEED